MTGFYGIPSNGWPPGRHARTSQPATVHIVRVAPPPIFYAGLLFVATVVLTYWWLLRRHLRDCTCPKPAPWWKRR